MRRVITVHLPGACPAHHSDCSGIATFDADPFAEEIYGDSTPVWMCEGERYESAMDI